MHARCDKNPFVDAECWEGPEIKIINKCLYEKKNFQSLYKNYEKNRFDWWENNIQ